LFYTGDPSLLGSQLLGILVTVVFVAVGALVIGLIVKAIFKGKLRVSKDNEARGLDITEHNESAYPAFIGLD
jgi:ammonium transporter, Amt family